MKKNWIILIISFVVLTSITSADVFITELADPNNNADARYIELYNNGISVVDFTGGSGWKINKYTNGSATVSSSINLNGSISAGGFYLISNDGTTFTSVYGFSSDYDDASTNGTAGSNGDDIIELVNGSGAVVDFYGVQPHSDLTSTVWEFEDGRAERANGATIGKNPPADSDWNTWSDGPGGDVVATKDAPGNFDPGAWIGATDETAPSFSSTYPKTSSVTATGFNVAVSLDEIGTAYFVVLVDGASTPLSSQVKAGTDASDSAVATTSKGTISVSSAGTEYTGSASSLNSSTAYDVYVVAEDDESTPNLQSSPTKIDVTTTVAASTPSVSTSAAATIRKTTATLNGSVTANNASTTVTFDYGETTSYGSSATADQSPLTGSDATSVSAGISSLSANTTYHFRVKAVNSEGTIYGSDATFTTTPTPVAPTANTVYISEVSDASGYQNEFIELYNNSSNYIDLSNCKIIKTGYVFDFSDGSGDNEIPPNGIIVIARGASKTNFESEWGSLSSSVYYSTGHTNLYFGTGTSYAWSLKDGGTADTDDGSVIDNTIQVVGGTSKRHYQGPVGTWTESTIGSATPGTLEDNQDSSLPVSLQDFNAVPGNSKVTLTWITESETENLGFNIYRGVNKNGEFLMLNAELIAGHGSTSERHEYSYVDRDVVNGVIYYYKLEDVDYAGKARLHDKVVSATPTSKESDANINEFQLYPCYPNPFNPETTLRFELTEAARISVQIYDLLGNRITTLTNSAYQPGEYSLSWNGRDHQNRLVGTGIYFLQISGDRGFSRTEKVIFLR